MDIGVVIKKYRKEAGMTQEEMANRLGVTTPAVNKWENSNSKPDIELLAPIARLLDISLDTLLSFHEKKVMYQVKYQAVLQLVPAVQYPAWNYYSPICLQPVSSRLICLPSPPASYQLLFYIFL